MHQRLPENGKIPASTGLAQHGVTECFTTVSGCQLRYLCAGESNERPPLLLIHGLLGYSFSWRFNIAALAEERRVYAIDLPGVGFSGRSPDLDCSVRSTASRLLYFLRERGISSADILGTSHGGGVAMMLAAIAKQSPEPLQVNKLVLVAPINPWSRHGLLFTSLLSTRFGSTMFRASRPLLRLAHGKILARLYGDRRRISPGTLDGYAAPMRIAGTVDHALKIAQCLRNDLNEIKTILPEISSVPTLLIWGDRDRAVAPQSAPLLKAQFRDAQLAIIEGCGHLPYEEVPQEFNRILLKFLD